MPTMLGQNQYGKAEIRLVRVTRDGGTHHLRDLTVSVALSGDLADVHLSGANAHVLPTDTMKNTVLAFARRHGVSSPEDFGILLAEHFVGSRPQIHRARVRVEEYAWERADGSAGPTGHSFARRGQETRTAEVLLEAGPRRQVVAGLTGLVVLNSTDSEFWGFAKDAYTTLQETRDRILATEVNARWRYAWSGAEPQPPDWDEAYARARADLLAAFAGTYSYSLQQTLYAMGARVVDNSADGAAVDEVRLSLPNKHHFLADLAPFGLDNPDEVYVAADRPYGLIEGTVLRDGAEARIPVTD